MRIRRSEIDQPDEPDFGPWIRFSDIGSPSDSHIRGSVMCRWVQGPACTCDPPMTGNHYERDWSTYVPERWSDVRDWDFSEG